MQYSIDNTIIIISGLPRSGTSMMMQLLHLGGINILTDDIRKLDSNNPKGYYEFEKVKLLATDTSWLYQANGKGLKVISHFIPYLPAMFHYKIIVMKRPIEEVLLSQQKMLGKPLSAIPQVLKDTFTKQLHDTTQYISKQANMELLEVNYHSMLQQPEKELMQIASFLNRELDMKKMLQGIDASLHRNKI